MPRTRRGFGQIVRLPSKRYRARYTGPDGHRHNAPHTFETTLDAEAWLTDERRRVGSEEWTPPLRRGERPRKALTLGQYVPPWLAHRDLKPRTREHYASLLDRQILPAFAETPLKAITPARVREWHAGLDPGRPTLRAHAYGLLRTVLQTAVHDGEIPANPCHIRGAGASPRVKQIRPATIGELEALVAAMPVKYRPMVLLAAWCALRFGELTELRRKDLDLTNAVIHVRRAVVRADGEVVIGTPKSGAGIRDVAMPRPLVPMLREHLRANITGGREGLLFPAADGTSHLAPATLYRSFYKAREATERRDLRFHDLRHTGAVLAASTGATLAELMVRLGHATPAAAMRYQHAARGRDAEIADALGRLMEGGKA